MKFYETSDPHYFLIKATDYTQALKKYLSVLDYIVDDDRECCQGMLKRLTEISEKDAYYKYLEESDLDIDKIDEVLFNFHGQENKILIQKL